MFIVVQLFGVVAVERVLARLEVKSVEHIRQMRRRLVSDGRSQIAPAALCRRQQRFTDNDAAE